MSEVGTVLVVDDEPQVRRMAASVLEAAGYRVFTADGGRAALDVYASRGVRIDAVVLDVAMPEMNGEATFHALRRLDPSARVLFSSGHAPRRQLQRLGGARPARFLAKPYHPSALIRAVKDLIAA